MNNKVVVYGLGQIGKRFIEQLGDINIKYIIDNNPNLYGLKYENISIISKEIFEKIYAGEEIVITSSRYKAEMKKDLLDLGIYEKKIFMISEYKIQRALHRNTMRIDGKRIFLMNVNDNVNIGDQLITQAELSFLKFYFPNTMVVPLGITEIREGIHMIKKEIKDEELILITGGGFMGTLWMNGGEENIRSIIKEFPQNPIIILPQTMYYNTLEEGEQEKKRTQNIYLRHDKLTICFRDRNSYELGNQLFGKKIRQFYMPDMATFMDFSKKQGKRFGFLVCLRDDKEGMIDYAEKQQLLSLLGHYNEDIRYISMLSEKPMFYETSMLEIEKKIRVIRSSKGVVTDRLHCMILCAITGTPCVAYDNLSRKLSGVYDWICENKYIKVQPDLDHMDLDTRWLVQQEPQEYNNEKTICYLSRLADLINEIRLEEQV